MPELPEVETVVRSLFPVIAGKTIHAVTDYPGHERVFEHVTLASLRKNCLEQNINGIRRRGKYIIISLNSGILAIHLRMTGVLKTVLSEQDKESHLAARFDFTDGTSLYFKDYRKFGRIYFFNMIEEMDSFLGVEPLSDDFSARFLQELLSDRKRKIKPFLLDQRYIVGLGNIYTDEALWMSQIHPETICSRIPAQRISLLHNAIRNVLEKAISLKGTTFMTFSFENGRSGNFRKYLNVFGKNGEPCPRCFADIKKMKVGQRGTHFCPACQKVP